jgi:7-carboxy-7-deazaguanine synthase
MTKLFLQRRVLTSRQAGLAARPGQYAINEVFRSVQGEGVLAGTVMTFLRFACCNLRCTVRNAGFDCDTDFAPTRVVSRRELLEEVFAAGASDWVLFTGGEPGLQLDTALVRALGGAGYRLAAETNGTVLMPVLDWICVSPKSAISTLRQRTADELKLVRAVGQDLPEDAGVRADHYLVSPAFRADGTLDPATVSWCVGLVTRNPKWRLSVQIHKILGVR